jgi:hypothetical protein
MSHQPNNVFAGTQVVSLVEVRGTNNSLVHPRGAVGVVTRTPTATQKSRFQRCTNSPGNIASGRENWQYFA